MQAIRSSVLRLTKPFHQRDYVVLASAFIIATFASGMWAVAMVYQVRQLGGGPLELSMVATSNAMGLLLFVLLGGVMADRHSCRRIVIGVEAINAVVLSGTALLALTGQLALWHLVVTGFVTGSAMAFFFPAYSALLPRILPADDLLAANGLEGTVRPVVHTALGPMSAGFLVAALSPAAAIFGVAVCYAVAWAVLCLIRKNPDYDRVEQDSEDEHGPKMLQQLREGASYTLKTPWLLWTLLFSIVSVFTFIGPFEVLIPFVVSDNLGGDARTFGVVLACFGVGSALGSMLTASARFPRRYLSVMTACWSLGTIPLALVGVLDSLVVLCSILFLFGVTDAIGMVIWGTLLQRRVPKRLLGRISSLDFFVSLALMPLSMAVAGPLAELVGLTAIFVVAGLASPIFGVIAWKAGAFARDELEHPLRAADTVQRTD
ncbi:tetracycline efflux MFS transporter Tet(V) [Glutamicibacter endophyticus]